MDVTSLRARARRCPHTSAVGHLGLSEEITEFEEQIKRLVRSTALELVALEGVGSDTAATLMSAAGDNPERLRSEAAFTHLCGTAPIPASSNKVVRHRLNPHGNREANWTFYMLALNRMRRNPCTQAYVERRIVEGKTKREIVRCLKRYVVREVYRATVPLGSEA